MGARLGIASIGGPPVTPDTLFQAASISKPVAAVAVLRLVDQGKLNLDTDVNQYLKSWKLPANEFTTKTKVTIRQLLTHTAGLTGHGFAGYAAGAPLPTRRALKMTFAQAHPVDAARPDLPSV